MSARLKNVIDILIPIILSYINSSSILLNRNIKISSLNWITFIGIRYVKDCSNDCLCCNNFTCPAQWSPSITMGHLICEYVTRNDFKVYCGKLQQKSIISIFNNEKWCIPDDIIMYIINVMV